MATDTKSKDPKNGPVTAPIQVAPRRVRLVLSRIDPWSMLKMSFLLSVAIGIASVVAVSLLWLILNFLGIFGNINSILEQLGQAQAVDNAASFGRVVSISTIFAVINVILMTTLSALAAVIYNISADLVGGFLLTLTDE